MFKNGLYTSNEKISGQYNYFHRITIENEIKSIETINAVNFFVYFMFSSVFSIIIKTTRTIKKLPSYKPFLKFNKIVILGIFHLSIL